jgi:hypothetical protein
MKLQVLRLLLALLTFAAVALATDCTDQARADCLQCCNDDESAGFAANSASLTGCQTLRDFDNGECNSNSNDDYYNCVSTDTCRLILGLRYGSLANSSAMILSNSASG